MKSAYEIAMEKMNKESGPTRSLSDAEKEKITEIDSKYRAQAAQTQLDYESRISVAEPVERAQLERDLAKEIQEIDEKREAEKDAVWNAASGNE